MSWRIETIFEQAEERLDREDKRLQNLASLIQATSDRFDRDGAFAMSRALNYVVCGGVLEKMMRDLPEALSQDLQGLGVGRNRLPIQTLAIIEATEFRRCTTGGVKALSARAKILKDSVSHRQDVRPLPSIAEAFQLADGTTVTPDHFDAIWYVLDIGGVWSNNQNDVLLLRGIAQKRNDIAHWDVDPVDLGRAATTSDFRRSTQQLRGLIENVHILMADWLDRL